MPRLIALALIAACGVTYFLWRRRSVGAERELLQLCHGDKEQMNRLIALELRKAPSLSRCAAAKQAIHSLRRDRR
jgi:hypothetical protein